MSGTIPGDGHGGKDNPCDEKEDAFECLCGGVKPLLASPVITGPQLFDDHDPEDLSPRPVMLRVEVPISAELMVAALYSEGHGKLPGELNSGADRVWERVAIVIVQDGLDAVEGHQRAIRDLEEHDMIRVPEWLALCRQRVGEAIESTSVKDVDLCVHRGQRGK
jgi:hypothetical protein